MGNIGYESPNLPRRNFQILILQVVYPKDLPLLSDWRPEVFGQRLELTLQDSWGPGNIPVMLEILVCWDNFRGLDSLDSWVVAVSHALVSWRWPESDYLLRPQIHYIAVSWPGGGIFCKKCETFFDYRTSLHIENSFYRKTEKLRRSTSITLYFLQAFLNPDWLLHWVPDAAPDVCWHCWPRTSYETSWCEPWHA